MRVLLSGARGLIGSALAAHLQNESHEVVRLVRTKKGNDLVSILWNPEGGAIDKTSLAGFDAVIHLAGENIAARRWSPEQKARIRDSRVNNTRLLSRTLAQLENPPRTLICASAIGFYGDRGNEILTETSPPGDGFLAEVCREWEEATAPAADKGIRVVNLRTGVVFASEGGALEKMIKPIRLGLGGKLGSGRQYLSWITLEDEIGAIDHLLSREQITGPVNLVSPQPVTNAEFTRKVAAFLNRRAFIPLPAFILRLAAGEMADALVLASERVQPAVLLSTDYQFKHPDLETALPAVLTP
ncbi:MAG: TIGR01777 family oxidoreductase [candidate division Zixibacteria bacterium]|nr:TIGR01777 family oxidoreductase [candidate division Zixibacteria bacterium]